MRIYKNNKGITLIALVVSIIVLLILAGISISMLTGQNGILNRATETKEKTEKNKNKKEFCRNHKTTSWKLLVLQFQACRFNRRLFIKY